MSNLTNNTIRLQEVINLLQDKIAGGTDTSDATATADEIFAGETAYGAEGKVTGTFTIDNELTIQDGLITQIATALQNKATGGSPTPTQEKTIDITTNGITTIDPDEGYALSRVTVNVDVPSGGGSENANYTKTTATPDSTTSFIIENPLGGIAKMVSIKAISPTITSSRKIHECCLDWNAKLGAVKAYYSSGNVTYVMTGIDSTPNNGNFRMTDGFITVYRFNSATTWDTSCAYEVEIYQ